ncbi:MAG: outer membrane protein transport protein [Muribaculaceae bacterium]|nr:outer membrane protein transport protein [Muribaculaceae bacterium]
MKKNIIILSLLGFSINIGFAQSAIGAFSLSQPDLKGTARFMGMAGAFGALGGDLSSISQNPAGIGVYRSSDIGFTLDLDLQSSNTQAEGMKYNMNQTKFLLNNIGAVMTLRLPCKTVPNINFGFTYNKGASFNRIYGGNINTLHNSMSNYIAGVANSNSLTENQLSYDDNNDPYYDSPWIAAMGFNSYLINPEYFYDSDLPNWTGLWNNDSMTGNNTSGSGTFLMKEWGGLNDFNIAIGGNIADFLYWGMNFDIVSMNYNLQTIWGESLTNAMVPNSEYVLQRGFADWNLNSVYNISGTGFNYQLGFILKPIQQFRLGFAFHTPTWYSLTEEYTGLINYNVGAFSGQELANDGVPGYSDYNFRTPWKIIASAAGVIGNNFILSFDYEWANYGKMHYSERTYYNGGYDWGYDPWYPWPYSAQPTSSTFFPDPSDPYAYENSDIANYYKSSNTIRLGLEFKPISSLSIRAGYSYVSSPVKAEAKDNLIEIYTSGMSPSYRWDNSTNYITCGLGYRYSHFYVDLAYVYKHQTADYHAFAPDIAKNGLPSPQSKVSLTNNQIVLSAGYRF